MRAWGFRYESPTVALQICAFRSWPLPMSLSVLFRAIISFPCSLLLPLASLETHPEGLGGEGNNIPRQET